MITRSNRLTLTEGRGTLDLGQVTEEPCDGKLSRTVLKGRRGVAISPADPNAWMLEQLRKKAPVITREGWLKDGNGTSQIRQHLGLSKDKANKERQSPETHAVDAIALACATFVQYKPFHTANTRGCIWVGSVSITPAIFKVISRPRITRRRLHDAVPAKGGVRERYGGSTTPFDIRKGDLVAYKDQLGYCSGYTGLQLSISDASWKRLGQRAISKCRLVARSTGLVVSGGLTPTQPPLLSLPTAQADGVSRR